MASDAATATGGELVGADGAFDGAGFDSRTIRSGELFVALIAERDGHAFIDAAVSAGAAAVLASDRAMAEPFAGRVPAIVVDDTAEALMLLGGWARQRLSCPVVGVTGSVGKTSTKDFIAGALGATRRITANDASFNNEQGLPVTILGAGADTEALVVEMGMRGFGEIARLADVARPTIGVVTAVAASHTGRVGGIEGVARAKRELVEALPADGTAVLNADDPRVAAMAAASPCAVVTYGRGGDVRLRDVVLDELGRPSFTVDTPWGSGDVQLAASGAHMAANAVAALAVVGVVEGRIDAALNALGGVDISARRMQVGRTSNGAVVINDSYNANPDSTTAALETVGAMPGERRIAVLGEMGELDDPPAGHARVAQIAERLGIEVVAVGTDLYGPEPVGAGGISDDDIDAAVEALGQLGPGDLVLVKASFASSLWRAADALLAR